MTLLGTHWYSEPGVTAPTHTQMAAVPAAADVEEHDEHSRNHKFDLLVASVNEIMSPKLSEAGWSPREIHLLQVILEGDLRSLYVCAAAVCLVLTVVRSRLLSFLGKKEALAGSELRTAKYLLACTRDATAFGIDEAIVGEEGFALHQLLSMEARKYWTALRESETTARTHTPDSAQSAPV